MRSMVTSSIRFSKRKFADIDILQRWINAEAVSHVLIINQSKWLTHFQHCVLDNQCPERAGHDQSTVVYKSHNIIKQTTLINVFLVTGCTIRHMECATWGYIRDFKGLLTWDIENKILLSRCTGCIGNHIWHQQRFRLRVGHVER